MSTADRLHLLDVSVRQIPEGEEDRYPFSVPAVQALIDSTLAFDTPITVFVGENGSGKSTLLEGIAAAANSITVGSASIETDPWMRNASRLGRSLRLSWGRRTKRGFFLRAEDYFGFAKQTQRNLDELKQDMEKIGEGETHSEFAISLAKGAFAGQIAALQSRYGDDLDAGSHGESFLSFFRSRFVPDGLYLLDEPESPLSPKRQLTLIAMLYQMTVNEGAQFIIATHSPLLMSIPGAKIVGFDDGALCQLEYDKVEHVALTRDFLQNPQAFLRHLWTDEELSDD